MSGTRQLHRLGRWLNATTLGVLFVTAAFAVSLGRVLTNQRELFDPTVKTIRVAHWQLELGFREALQAVIDEYNRLHAADRVRVVQMPVTEKVYPQWLNTHLISGTAPDLAQLGMAKLAHDSQYVAKFFTPLGELVNEPNPYNAGTELEGRPWRETFVDGMAGGYRTDLQEYYGVPLVLWNMRLFYNRELLAAATGRATAPATFGQLLADCRAVREWGARQGRDLIPIAGSKYSLGYFLNALNVPFFAVYQNALDLDRDGQVGTWETWAGYMRGDWDFATPRVRAYYECLRALTEQFGAGFMAMERDQAAFLFVQGRAAMIASGSWDARSLFQQAAFPVGVMDFPLPAPTERWGEFIAGRRNEAATAAGAALALNRQSAHPEWALDFLKFLSSQRINEQFNRQADWLPATLGAKPAPHMAAFMPDPVGFFTGLEWHGAGRISAVHDGQLWLYLQGEIDYPTFAREMARQVADPQTGWATIAARLADDTWRRQRTTERFLAARAAVALLRNAPPDSARVYERMLWQQAGENNGETLRWHLAGKFPPPGVVRP